MRATTGFSEEAGPAVDLSDDGGTLMAVSISWMPTSPLCPAVSAYWELYATKTN